MTQNICSYKDFSLYTSVPEKALVASEVEANLKAILMGGMSVGAKTHDSIGPKMYGTATQPPGICNM